MRIVFHGLWPVQRCKGSGVQMIRLPIAIWARRYESDDVRSDLVAGLTVAAMLVPQAMAYALLAGLPPQVGLYAATVPVLVYAVLGTSRQLAVGPVAIVSLLTATALAPFAEEGTATYLAAAAILALVVGVVHLVVGFARLGKLVNLLSHAVLVGFTSAAAIIIGFSQVRHILGVSIPRQEHFYDTVFEVVRSLSGTHWPTFIVGALSLATLRFLKARAPRLPGALLTVVGSILAVHILSLEDRGVSLVGAIPDQLPAFSLPTGQGSLVIDLIPSALLITLVGFMESIAVARVYARRHGYSLDPNQELIGLGAANIASGVFGGYPVTGGFSRTAVNDSAGARTPLASIVTAILVLVTLAFLTPLLEALPNAALGAIIISAVIGLVDVKEIKHIAHVKRSDLISLGVAFAATLLLGIEIGIAVAVVASMLVVFARMSAPHKAILGQVDRTTYRNVDRFPEATTHPGITILRIDAAVSFINSENIKTHILEQAQRISNHANPVLVLDASGINDIDVTGVEMLKELLDELHEFGSALHLADLKGPVRDVLRRSGLWDDLEYRIHASTHDAVKVVQGKALLGSLRESGIDERGDGTGMLIGDGRNAESTSSLQQTIDHSSEEKEEFV